MRMLFLQKFFFQKTLQLSLIKKEDRDAHRKGETEVLEKAIGEMTLGGIIVSELALVLFEEIDSNIHFMKFGF
jgi:hypothetical protein